MTAAPASAHVLKKYDRLLAVVAANPGWVAFSGGVDSTLLLRSVAEVDPVLAVALFADSPLQTRVDRDNVSFLADRLGVQLRVVALNPLLWPDFVANPRERCYLCKKSVYRCFQALLPPGALLFDGSNCDDLDDDDRPGRRAIAELGVVSPLAMAGLDKHEVREMARRLGLPNWNRPSGSCLATRIPTGFAILPQLLRHIEECESLVSARGFGHVRIRLTDGCPEDVTVELANEEMEDCDFPARRDEFGEALRRLGIVRLRIAGRDGVFIV